MKFLNHRDRSERRGGKGLHNPFQRTIPISALSALSACKTANTAEGEMQLSAIMSANAANLAGIADGDWGLISPFGEHPSPDGSYVQKFSREQADKVVATWNSITGTAARVFKNLWHGLGAKNTCPVWDGHPETDKKRWPITKLLAEITDLRVGESGLEGRLTWNAKGDGARTRGPLFPSSLWWHWPPAGNPPAVFPELLESVGLVSHPNISGVPAWTHNSTLASQMEAQSTQNKESTMLKKLIEKLGLKAEATEDQVTDAVAALQSTANSNAASLTTANAAKADLETQLTTANGKVTALEGEKVGLTTEVANLTTANAALTDGILDAFEVAGKITPAQRPEAKAKFTANGAQPAAVITELKEKKPAMNTQALELNGKRIDISTANARQAALESAVSTRMKADGVDYSTAFARVQADPEFKQLFEAMSDPTKKPAA